jgi:hypothetical protein
MTENKLSDEEIRLADDEVNDEEARFEEWVEEGRLEEQEKKIMAEFDDDAIPPGNLSRGGEAYELLLERMIQQHGIPPELFNPQTNKECRNVE